MAELTEQFGQAMTNRVRYTKTLAVNGTVFINLIRDLLVSAGWSLTGGISPWAAVWTSFLLSSDCEAPEVTEKVCGQDFFYNVTNAGNKRRVGLFDPRFEMACGADLAPKGCTFDETVESLASQIALSAASSGWVIDGYPPNRWESDGPNDTNWPPEAGQLPPEGIRTIIIESPTPGTDHNGQKSFFKFASGMIITNDVMYHGGWALDSASANGRTSYRLEITEEVKDYIRFRFRYEGGFVDYWIWLGYGEIFDIIGDPYQIAVFCDTSETRQQGFFASAPYSPEARGINESVIIIGSDPRSDIVVNEWGKALYWTKWSQALNGPLHKVSGTGKGMPNIPNLRHGSAPVLTPDHQPVAQTPWVQMSRSPTNEGGIVGQLWDSVVMGDWFPHDRSMYLKTASGGRIYRRMCALSGYAGRTPCSLWLATQ